MAVVALMCCRLYLHVCIKGFVKCRSVASEAPPFPHPPYLHHSPPSAARCTLASTENLNLTPSEVVSGAILGCSLIHITQKTTDVVWLVISCLTVIGKAVLISLKGKEAIASSASMVVTLLRY